MVRHPNARRIGLDAKQSAKTASGLSWKMVSGRTHDDARVPVLASPLGLERPRYASGFQARRLTLFSSSFPCRLLSSESHNHIVLVGKDNCFVRWVISFLPNINDYCRTDKSELPRVA
jgi:hypothetical protein